MQRRLQLIALLALVFFGRAAAQCTVDSAALAGGSYIYPAPSTSPNSLDSGIYVPACVGLPFEFTLTFSVPDTINYPGLPLPLLVNYVEVAPTGAVLGAPAWMSYSCGPTTCKWLKNTLGCLKLFGTPPPGTPDSDVDLKISVTVSTNLATLPIELPGGVLNIPGKYTLRTRQAGDPLCTVSTRDFSSVVRSASIAPNPVSGMAKLNVTALATEKAQFDVIDIFGKTLRTQSVQLVAGENALLLDASDLPAGSYFYRLSNQKGRMTGKFTVAQ